MNSSEAYSETRLMTLIAQGDESAFEELYDLYKNLVFGLVTNIVGDKPTAEEIMMDVFAQVWRHAIAFQSGRASIKSWLLSIARHRAIDELRRRRVRQDQIFPQWADDQLADQGQLDVQYELHDLRMHVRKAIAQLPVDQQDALALAYFKGYSHRQIAETLNRPLGSVKTQIRKAMQQLREIFTVGDKIQK